MSSLPHMRRHRLEEARLETAPFGAKLAAAARRRGTLGASYGKLDSPSVETDQLREATGTPDRNMGTACQKSLFRNGRFGQSG